MTTGRYPRQRGVSVTELMIAIALMTVLTSAVGNLASYVARAIETRHRFRLLQWELDNARQQIGSWSTDEITQDRILSLPFSPKLRQSFSKLAWNMDLQPLEIDGFHLTPAITTVRLSISAEYRDQAIQPVELYFWISASQGSDRTRDAPNRQIEQERDAEASDGSSPDEKTTNGS